MSESEHKHIFRPIKEKPNFCWQCGVAEIDGTFYYPSFQFDKLKEQNEKLKEAINEYAIDVNTLYTQQPQLMSYKKMIEALKSC